MKLVLTSESKLSMIELLGRVCSFLEAPWILHFGVVGNFYIERLRLAGGPGPSLRIAMSMESER